MRKVLTALYLLYAALIFIGLMFLVLPLVLLAYAVLNVSSGKRAILFFLRCWAWAFSLPSLFWVKTINQHYVDQSEPHIYIGNHGSYLDAIAVCISIPQYFSPLGKVEMTKIPVFGLIYERIVVLIDRSSKESREKSVEILKANLAKGESILIFPEGTMNKTDRVLSEFYDGAFRIAIETKTPILPFVMINNRRLLPRVNPLNARPGFIKTVFIAPISVVGLTIDDLPALKTKIFNIMEEEILKHN